VYTLYIGNKNYSSWSLRPWLALRAAGIAFEERRVALFSESFAREIAAVSPAGRVPVLVDDGFSVWDSLAIIEYAADRDPDALVWPRDGRARARARSICAEMHSGFPALRSRMPMNVEARLPGRGWDLQVQRDIDRICAIWTNLRAQNAAAGPFLFGGFTAADAYFAPVVLRFRTYEPALPEAAHDYMRDVLGHPAMREWIDAACAEGEFLPEDEPYRASR
jgi:glutathione S-transferase